MESAAVEMNLLTDAAPGDGKSRRSMEPGAMLLEVERATVRFGTFTAVNNASFQLRGGELLGLIGPNGAGKTTLLRAIASLQMMSGGEVRVLGHRLKAGDE